MDRVAQIAAVEALNVKMRRRQDNLAAEAKPRSRLLLLQICKDDLDRLLYDLTELDLRSAVQHVLDGVLDDVDSLHIELHGKPPSYMRPGNPARRLSFPAWTPPLSWGGPPIEGQASARRNCRRVATDRVFAAWPGGDLAAMEAVINEPTTYVDRHHLLSCIVQCLYATRHESRDRERLYHYGRMHLSELPALMPFLLADSKGETFHIGTFGLLELALCEDGKPDEARDVWAVARAIGYSDESAMPEIEAGIAKRMKRLANKASKT